ncbi:MAG: hypothetical protein P4L83_09670 [Nevskia sp.]|nr:hypothetical protein [Nevskia sp.]
MSRPGRLPRHSRLPIRRYPLLQHQDAIGAGIMAFSLLGMLATGTLYYFGLIA